MDLKTVEEANRLTRLIDDIQEAIDSLNSCTSASQLIRPIIGNRIGGVVYTVISHALYKDLQRQLDEARAKLVAL